jgi:hypothetical protein
MKNKIKIISIVLFISTCVLLASCQKQKAEWKGTIEEVDGVTVVKNPDEPLYGELVFDLEEDLSIGKEDDDNYMFFRIGDIKVDGNGNIYVFEFGNKRVQKFGRDGKYTCTIGAEGQGPGEYQFPLSLLINDKTGVISVMDRRKLVVFDMDGNYLDKDIFLEGFFYPLIFDSSGTLWGINEVWEGDDEVTASHFRILVKLNDKGQIAEKFAKFPYEFYIERMASGAVFSTSTGEEYDLSISSLGEQNIVYGYSKEYELNIIDLEGNLEIKIKKDEPYQKFSAEERGKYKRAKLPDHKPFFYSLFTDSEGRIYAQRNNARLIETVEKTFDVFSEDGYYLYKTVCPLTSYAIKDGFFYTRIMNEDTGEVFVKRYKIKNWNQIKKGI